LKIHIAVNINTKKILLTMKITTDERGNDNIKALPELVEENIIKSDSITVAIDKLFCHDGAYEGNDFWVSRR
jgi:hypothetical protein